MKTKKRILGVDLAGSEKRNTGICFLDDSLKAKTKIVFSDHEIRQTIDEFKPDLIAIDAPLSLPKGRESLDRKSNIHFRECDRKLLELRIKFFPITLGPMRLLTKRGIALKKIFQQKYEVIEVFPGASADIFGLPRVHLDYQKLVDGLIKFGLKIPRKELSFDEIDAILCAFTGYLYLKNQADSLGDSKEGVIVVPSLEIFLKKWKNRGTDNDKGHNY